MTSWLLPLAVGFGTGILSAWGVGGGTLLLLIMTLFLGVEQTAAQGINLLYFLPTAGVSLFFHRKNGLLDKNAIRQAVPAGLAAAAAGALLATAVDVTLMRKPFGVFLLYSGVMMLRQNRKQKK
ncbi:MAG: sulfite exporter TauE/SafE family protein [Ruminococcaceae bacterium]|nr:sulfite exporter TauE/SafE family protein [Oscillospiraceae bacterium]